VRNAPPVRYPPWAWLYLVLAAVQVIPGSVAFLHEQMQEIEAPDVPGAGIYWLLLAALAVPTVFLAAGVVFALVPPARRWVVERAHHPLAVPTGDLATLAAEVQQFVDRHTTGVQVRLSASSSDYARIYPVTWHRARLLVFRPFTRRWMSPDPAERQAAESLLLHEIAHHRQGEHLILGLGSPFSWLVRIWVAAFTLLTLAPIVVLTLSGDIRGPAALPELARDLPQPLLLLMFPVAATWLSELAADDWAAQLVGPQPIIRALSPEPVIQPARPKFVLLDHPPRALRRRLLGATAGPAAAIWLTAALVAWPFLVGVRFLVAAVSVIAQALLAGYAADQLPDLLAHGVGVTLDSAWWDLLASMVVLLTWPQLARIWPRLWTVSGPAGALDVPPSPLPSRPTASYLTAAVFPALLLLATLVPLPAIPALPEPPIGSPDATDGGLMGPTAFGRLDPSRQATQLTVLRIIDFRGSGDSVTMAEQRAELIAGAWTFLPDGSFRYTTRRLNRGSVTRVGTWTAAGSVIEAGFHATDGSATERLTSLIDITPSPPRMQLIWTSSDPDAPRVSAILGFQATVEIAAT
jgi:hypothetical protein